MTKAIVKKTKNEIQSFVPTESMGVMDEVTAADIQLASVMLMQASSTLSKDRTNEIQSGDFVHSISNERLGSFEKPIELCVFDLFKTQVVTEVKGNNWIETNAWLPSMESESYLDTVDGVDIKRQKCFNYLCFDPAQVRSIEMPDGTMNYVASPIAVKFKGASAKNAKKFNAMLADLATFKQQSWCVSFDLTAYEETNDDGSFFVYSFVKNKQTSKEVQQAAYALNTMSREARAAGKIQVVDSDESQATAAPVTNASPQNFAPQATQY